MVHFVSSQPNLFVIPLRYFMSHVHQHSSCLSLVSCKTLEIFHNRTSKHVLRQLTSRMAGVGREILMETSVLHASLDRIPEIHDGTLRHKSCPCHGI